MVLQFWCTIRLVSYWTTCPVKAGPKTGRDDARRYRKFSKNGATRLKTK